MRDVKLASRMAALQESATLALNAKAKALAKEGRTIYNLTAGELESDTPHYIQEAVAKVLDKNKYTPVAGLSELRQAIAEVSAEFYDLSITPEQVVVTSGAKLALYATFLALLGEGDEVIVPIPAWVSYLDLIRLAGGKPVLVPLTDDYDLDVAALKAAITAKTKAIVVNSPHNPTGAILSDRSVKALAAALKDSDITVIADDIYCRLAFAEDYVPVPKAGFDNLIIVNGFSKSQALTGWRIGYLIAAEPVAKAATVLLSHITGNAPLPAQYAGLAAMERKDEPPAENLATLQRNSKIVSQGLTDAGIKHNQPGGAFYVYLDLRDKTDDSAMWCADMLEKTGVALVPGEAFETPGFARLSFVTDEETLRAALKAIKDFMT